MTRRCTGPRPRSAYCGSERSSARPRPVNGKYVIHPRRRYSLLAVERREAKRGSKKRESATSGGCWDRQAPAKRGYKKNLRAPAMIRDRLQLLAAARVGLTFTHSDFSRGKNLSIFVFKVWFEIFRTITTLYFAVIYNASNR